MIRNIKSLSNKATFATFCFVVCTAGTAFGQVNNGGFETGNFTGWTTAGDNLVIGNTLGINPPEGSFQALSATSTDGTINSNIVAGTGVYESTLESQAGLTNGSLSAVGNGTNIFGSEITQTLSAGAGSSLNLSWDFLTNQVYYDGTSASFGPDPNNNDFSYVSIVDLTNSTSTVFKLADTFYGYSVAGNAAGFITGFTTTASTNPFISETGYHNFRYDFSTAGSYEISIGAVNAATGPVANGINSAVLVDNVTLTNAAPEPSGLVAAALLLALPLFVRRANR